MIRVIPQQIRCVICLDEYHVDGFKVEFEDHVQYTNTIRLCQYHASVLASMLSMQLAPVRETTWIAES